MTVKEIVTLTATFLGRREIINLIKKGEEAGESVGQSVEALVDLTNVVINELAFSYIPSIKIEDAVAKNRRVYYKDLSETALKIHNVYDMGGKKTNFSYTPEYIIVGADKVSVEYEYSPKAKTIDEDVCYMEKDVPARVIAYGVASEFCIVEGDFDQAVMWHKRYTDAIADICLPKNKTIAARRWA